MNKENFNLDKFLNHLELDEDMAMAEVSKPGRDRTRNYRKCPRCGSDAWKLLNVNERGKAISCNKCEACEQ